MYIGSKGSDGASIRKGRRGASPGLPWVFKKTESNRMYESKALILKGSCNASYNDYLFNAVRGKFTINEARRIDGV